MNCEYDILLCILLEYRPISSTIVLLLNTIVPCLYYTTGNIAMPDSIQMTPESDLSGESPWFTLTCNSTGGPATTVTWTRDSEDISGGMTALDDPVTAQYIHTFNVTGRLGGLYQCTVSNSKPSKATASFYMQGKIGRQNHVTLCNKSTCRVYRYR